MRNVFARGLLISLAMFLFTPFVVQGQRKSANSVPPYQLTAMKIVPYDQRTSTFLPEIENEGEFWNELSLSLFVEVQVTGQNGSYESGRQVEFTVFEGGRLILRRVAKLGVIDESTGKYYLPRWLYGPFCQPVTITARLVGQKQSSLLRRRLNFLCGE